MIEAHPPKSSGVNRSAMSRFFINSLPCQRCMRTQACKDRNSTSYFGRASVVPNTSAATVCIRGWPDRGSLLPPAGFLAGTSPCRRIPPGRDVHLHALPLGLRLRLASEVHRSGCLSLPASGDTLDKRFTHRTHRGRGQLPVPRSHPAQANPAGLPPRRSRLGRDDPVQPGDGTTLSVFRPVRSVHAPLPFATRRDGLYCHLCRLSALLEIEFIRNAPTCNRHHGPGHFSPRG